MKPIFVRPASKADAITVAERLRDEDRAEVLAAGGIDPGVALPAQVGKTEMFAAGLQSNDRAEILFGCDPVAGYPYVGVIWMLSTPVLFDHPVEFVITSRQVYQAYHEQYRVLTNFVDARNERHIEWLRWLGFHMLRRVERFGAQSLPFIEFASYKECA